MKKIVIEDSRDHGKHDVWQSEIRVDRDVAIRKLLKFFKHPRPKSKLAEKIVRDERVLRGSRKGIRGRRRA